MPVRIRREVRAVTNSSDKHRSGFRVSARTLLQLGGELISSDGIAFYELIKNAVDAGSPKVFVDVVMRLPLEVANEAKQRLQSLPSSTTPKAGLAKVKTTLTQAILPDAPG